MSAYKLQIPTPCTQDWMGMTPNAKGKFCSSCDKTVIDFTHMTDVEIQKYFTQYHHQKTCAYIKSSQLEANTNEALHILLRYRSQALKIKFSPLRYSALLFIGFAISISACETKNVQDKKPNNKTLEVDTVNEHHTSQSDSINKDTNTLILKGEVNYNQVNVVDDSIRMGKVIPPQSKSKIIKDSMAGILCEDIILGVISSNKK